MSTPAPPRGRRTARLVLGCACALVASAPLARTSAAPSASRSAARAAAPRAAAAAAQEQEGAVPADDLAPHERAALVTERGGLYRPDVGPRLELALADAIDTALRNNLGLRIEEQTTRIAGYDARGSWGAFDWVLDTRGSVTESEFQGQNQLAGGEVLETSTQALSVDLTKPLASTGGTFLLEYARQNTETNNAFSIIDPSTSDTLRVSYVQPLLRGAWEGYATSSQRIAESDWHRQRERERQVRQDVVRDVAFAYWNLVAALDQLDVVESSLALGREQLQQDLRRFEAGVGTEVEVLQAETEVARRIELLLRAQVDVVAAEDALKELLFPGADVEYWDTTILPATALPGVVDAEAVPDWRSVLPEALAQRPELRQQRLAIDAAELSHLRAKSERRVGLDLDLAALGQGFDGDPADAFETATTFDFPTYTAGLSLTVPFGNRTRRFAERAARAALRRARLEYDQLEVTVVASLRDAVRQVRYQAEAVRAATRSVQLAQRQLEAEQARYQEGLSTNFQVLEFQQDLLEAESSERAARAAYARALVALRAARGVLGEEPAPRPGAIDPDAGLPDASGADRPGASGADPPGPPGDDRDR